MNLRDYAVTMAHYNRWMNDRLYAIAADMGDVRRRADLGAFFGSVHATLNHLYVGDEAWMQRFQGEPVTMKSPRDQPFGDFETLRAARVFMDDRILNWAEALTTGDEARVLRFHSVSYGRDRVLPFHAAVMQLFNHQTHHRGQISTLLSQQGLDLGITDLPWMPHFD